MDYSSFFRGNLEFLDFLQKKFYHIDYWTNFFYCFYCSDIFMATFGNIWATYLIQHLVILVIVYL